MTTDPRIALRATYARWLRIRATVRGLATRLAAAEFGLRRDAAGSDDPDLATLSAARAVERRSLDELSQALDAHLGAIKRATGAIEAAHVEALITSARATRRSK